MSPHISLEIENNIPHLHLVTDNETKSRITLIDEDLSKIIPSIAKSLGIPEANTEALLEIANTADEFFFDETPEVSAESVEFELSRIAEELTEKAMNAKTDYDEVELTDELREELEIIKKHDLLASLINILYKIIITKTLVAAHDLEINEVHFKGDSNYPRLTERLGKELDGLGVELFVD